MADLRLCFRIGKRLFSHNATQFTRFLHCLSLFGCSSSLITGVHIPSLLNSISSASVQSCKISVNNLKPWNTVSLINPFMTNGLAHYYHLNCCMGKPTICICKNKDADQLRGNGSADQRLCFHYMDSTLPPLLKSEISIF